MQYAQELLDQVLSAIERRELRSLQWGFVDGSLGDSEIRSLVREVFGSAENQPDPDDLVEALVQGAFIFERQGADGTFRYRSRFAEGVRLLSTLRQLFPNRPWLSSPGLVSDYRVDAHPRAFPRRDIPAAAALEIIRQIPRWSSLHSELAEALIRPGAFSLAAFQLRAIRHVFGDDQADSGVVVCAGTGSGKTLTFYLPAVVEIGSLVQPNDYWVKAITLYPRIELLKDQFTQAHRFVRGVDNVLLRRGRRPIKLGALFSLTPKECTLKAVQDEKWAESGGGFICPFLTCPDCGSDLLWLRHDIERGVERLRCCRAPQCTGTVTSDQVALSRREMVDHPPDLVFTTTEMLNRRLSDTLTRHVLGVTRRREQKPRLVLLDEVHTYSGPTGAQTALVLRRWRHAIGAPVRFVGLSATLREAPQFFADLVGLDAGAVVEAAPTDDELDHRSMLYQVVLRGNPASLTQLLSTSIQASFLLARILDSPAALTQPGRSAGHFGSRLFVFTDDLDVTNRLFDNLRDAEAYDIFGRPDPKREPLAAMRSSNRPDARVRDRVGQNWRSLETIGHSLNQRLRISRTSSQDSGVSSTSNVVVATSSLELGFNDPTVGAVLQHKSPHGMAAYVQRKGRAGRSQEMRPWVVTVLSDYGRDRLTFQAYDQLFDPVLTPQRLPVMNRYILRMQTVLAFLDWLAESLAAEGLRGWMWWALNGPADGNATVAKLQAAICARLTALLENDGPLLQQMTTYLRSALQLEDEGELASVLWEPPRSLLLEVIPTLLRRLETQWRIDPKLGGAPRADLMAAGGAVHPLPDFIPSTLFSALNVPDVTLVIPPATRRLEERRERLGIVQALCHLPPGRITRRFAVERGALNHWVPTPLEGGEYSLPVSRYAEEHEFIATVTTLVEGSQCTVPCFRPWTVRLQSVSERDVSPTTNASLCWRGQIDALGEPIIVSTSHNARWGAALLDAAFYLHNFRTPLTVRRFALEAEATIRRPGVAEEFHVRTRFTTDDGQPAAIGFEQAVDGIRLRVRLPQPETLSERVLRSTNAPAWRAACFRDRVLQDPELAVEANWFQRDWLQQIYLSALVAKADQMNVSLADARVQLQQSDPRPAFQEVMDCIFRIDAYQEDDTDQLGDTVSANDRRQTLWERLSELLSRPAVLERLHTLTEVLWHPDDNWGAWLETRISDTIAEAALQACQLVAPSFVASDSLLVDVLDAPPTRSPEDRTVEIWITEATLGGAGAIEAIASEVSGNPRRLLAALDAALTPTDLELVAAGLESFLRLTQHEPEVSAAVQSLRQQENHLNHQVEFRALVALLARKGLTVDPSLNVALHQRLLRQGTSPESDRLVHDLLTYWEQAEERFAVAIDLRVFCYLAVSQPVFSDRVQQLILENTGAKLSMGDRVAILAGLLWPRSAEQRSRALQSYNPFRTPGWTDPSLVRDLLRTDAVRTIAFGDADWWDQLHAALAEMGMAHLACSGEQEEQMHETLYLLLAEPINVDYLQFFLAIDDVRRNERTTTVTLAIKEIV